MWNILVKIFIVTCMLNGCALALLCPEQNSYEPLDIDRLAEIDFTFYDVTDIPYYPSSIDCWDYSDFVKMDDGFAVNMTEHVHGRPGGNLKAYVHFIDNGDGTYSPNLEHKEEYVRTTKESVSHKVMTEEMLTEIEGSAEFLHSSDFFFLTDYENYFILGVCWNEGLLAVVKNRRVSPTAQDTLNYWNEFIKYGEIPQNKVEFKQDCINRQL